MYRSVNWTTMAPFLVLVAGVSWGIIGLFSQTLASLGLSSVQITIVRCVIAALSFGAYLVVFDRGSLRIRLRDLWMFLGTGVCSIAFFNVCYFACIRECGLSIACILLYTAPCFVTVLSRLLFGEPLTRVKLVALVGAFVGCLLVVGILTGDMNVSAAGLLFGLGSGIGYAFYSIFGRFALERYGSMTVTFYTFLFASLVLLPIGDVGQIATLALGNGFALAVMLLIGMVSTVLPFTCYTNGLRHMETSKASIMAFVEPMVALLIGVLVFHDVLTVGNGIGIVLIVAAVLLLNLAPAKVVEEDQRGA